MLRVLGLIPARGGSKGVPRKNLRPLGGRPLLGYTTGAALAARSLDRVVLSTDDREIAAVGTALGVEVPFLRPPDLAADDTPMLDVLTHALEALDEAYDAVCLLQPTSPFRPTGLIDRCVARFGDGGVDAVATVVPVPAEHNPHWVYLPDADGHLRLATGEDTPIGRRQDLPPAYHRDGSVYVFATAGIRAGRPYGDRLAGVVLDPAGLVNIDDAADWARAEALVVALP